MPSINPKADACAIAACSFQGSVLATLAVLMATKTLAGWPCAPSSVVSIITDGIKMPSFYSDGISYLFTYHLRESKTHYITPTWKTALLASFEISLDLSYPTLLTRTCPLSLRSNPIHLLRTHQPQNRPSSRSSKMTLPPQKTPKSEWLSLKHKASPRQLRFSSATLMKRIKAHPRSQSRKPSRRQSIMNRLNSYRKKGRVRVDPPS